jgi:hypothetical protein
MGTGGGRAGGDCDDGIAVHPAAELVPARAAQGPTVHAHGPRRLSDPDRGCRDGLVVLLPMRAGTSLCLCLPLSV